MVNADSDCNEQRTAADIQQKQGREREWKDSNGRVSRDVDESDVIDSEKMDQVSTKIPSGGLYLMQDRVSAGRRDGPLGDDLSLGWAKHGRVEMV